MSVSLPLRVTGLILAILCGAMFSSRVVAQSSPLVQPANLVYQGSFRVPGMANGSLEYGGTSLAFDSARQGIYIVGHDWYQRTAVIGVPAINGTATVIEQPNDALEGRIGAIGSGNAKVGGQLLYKGRLYVTAYLFYDATGSQTVSHFSRPGGSLSPSGQVAGPVRAGALGAGFYSGYMAHVPAQWQSAFGGPAMTGNCCLSIISRTSFGPAAFAFNPESLGTSTPLVHYTSDHQTLGTYGASGSHPQFNGTTRIRGLVFPDGTASVLFFGVTGVGPYCYGEAAECGDPTNSSKGEHAYPYRGYVWAYNANDLAAVKAGTKQPWQVVPYATWELSNLGDIDSGGIGGATYDPATGRVFVSEVAGDGALPRIHVYKVNVGTTTTVPPPSPPQNVRIIR